MALTSFRCFLSIFSHSPFFLSLVFFLFSPLLFSSLLFSSLRFARLRAEVRVHERAADDRVRILLERVDIEPHGAREEHRVLPADAGRNATKHAPRARPSVRVRVFQIASAGRPSALHRARLGAWASPPLVRGALPRDGGSSVCVGPRVRARLNPHPRASDVEEWARLNRVRRVCGVGASPNHSHARPRVTGTRRPTKGAEREKKKGGDAHGMIESDVKQCNIMFCSAQDD